MSRACALAIALCCLSAAAPPAGAVVIYDNLGAGNSFGIGGGVSVSGFQFVGVRFVPTSPGYVTDVSLAMRTAFSGAVPITLEICTDDSGHPGAPIGATTTAVTGGLTA